MDILIWYFSAINLHSNSSNVGLQWNKDIGVTNGDSVTLGKLIQTTDNAFEEKITCKLIWVLFIYFNYVVFIGY